PPSGAVLVFRGQARGQNPTMSAPGIADGAIVLAGLAARRVAEIGLA
ncbi:MAG: hypothetical protein ACI867_000811, partial [Glaciecola sp.]